MGFIELLIIAIGLAMDAFAVSIGKGLSVRCIRPRHALSVGLWFGGFQALMPLIGFFLGALFYNAISSFDHWIACGLLALIGGNMLKEALGKEEECEECNCDLSFKTMFVMAIATSIDALAVGISLAMTGDVVRWAAADGQITIWAAVACIGVTTGLFSAVGVKIGNVFGSRFEKKAEIAGGVILILLGLKILLEHLGVIG